MFFAEPIATGINAPGNHAVYIVAFADATTLLPKEISLNRQPRYFAYGISFRAV
jgi:hypothetical protein